MASAGRGEQNTGPPPPAPEAGGLALSDAAADGPGDGFFPDQAPEDQLQAISVLQDIEVGEMTLPKLENEYNQRKLSKHALQSISTELDKRKIDLLGEIQLLCQRLKSEGPRDAVERLMSVLEVLKDLGQRESDFQSCCRQKCTSMELGIMELEKDIYNDDGNKVNGTDLDQSIIDAHEKLNFVKRELGAKLRGILSLKRQIDDVPVQSELIQYEQRFAELNVQIQERLRQTRKHYDTYNALLEIKELMLKEISLLNSINSQFQQAIVNTAGRSKLIDSMEAILRGTQQKLKKVEIDLDLGQRSRDSLKEKYSTTMAAQRRFSSLLKTFQEECEKHERLQNLTSA
ncbi:hypothetical protein Taro_036160 [Colocasia esculenta]|uniref:CCDC93 coiled-coil domain-containing protein n=1 Tax=Colocasia esculenta TaxID=4460 RepID=A0A843WKU7_COLES|nr:hypothetical protein [Colocasia esculenta]